MKQSPPHVQLSPHLQPHFWKGKYRLSRVFGGKRNSSWQSLAILSLRSLLYLFNRVCLFNPSFLPKPKVPCIQLDQSWSWTPSFSSLSNPSCLERHIPLSSLLSLLLPNREKRRTSLTFNIARQPHLRNYRACRDSVLNINSNFLPPRYFTASPSSKTLLQLAPTSLPFWNILLPKIKQTWQS